MIEDPLVEEAPIELVRLIPVEQAYLSEIVNPVKTLWARVIIRALYDYVNLKDSSKLKDRREFETVRKWLLEPSDLSNGLENLCRFLNWPVGMLRARVLAMTRDDVKKMEFREREQGTNGDRR